MAIRIRGIGPRALTTTDSGLIAGDRTHPNLNTQSYAPRRPALTGRRPAGGGGEDVPLLRPRHVDRRKPHRLRELRVHGVGPLHDNDPRVLAEFPFQHAVAGVDGVNLRRPPLEEAVGEPAGVAAEVGADEAG